MIMKERIINIYPSLNTNTKDSALLAILTKCFCVPNPIFAQPQSESPKVAYFFMHMHLNHFSWTHKDGHIVQRLKEKVFSINYKSIFLEKLTKKDIVNQFYLTQRVNIMVQDLIRFTRSHK